MQRAQVGKITDLDRKVRDFVARDIKLHELVHLSNFFWERDKTVVVGHEALELLEQAHRGREVGQLVTTERCYVRSQPILRGQILTC